MQRQQLRPWSRGPATAFSIIFAMCSASAVMARAPDLPEGRAIAAEFDHAMPLAAGVLAIMDMGGMTSGMPASSQMPFRRGRHFARSRRGSAATIDRVPGSLGCAHRGEESGARASLARGAIRLSIPKTGQLGQSGSLLSAVMARRSSVPFVGWPGPRSQTP
jgi:hypothetical protein